MGTFIKNAKKFQKGCIKLFSNDYMKRVNIELLERINFNWELSDNDLIAYAICIFYVLINREIQIKNGKIVKEFLRELHSHYPRRTMKEAEIIAEQIFSELKN